MWDLTDPGTMIEPLGIACFTDLNWRINKYLKERYVARYAARHNALSAKRGDQ